MMRRGGLAWLLAILLLLEWGCTRAEEGPEAEEETSPGVEVGEEGTAANEGKAEGEEEGEDAEEGEEEKPLVFQAAPPPYKPGEELTFSLRWSGWNAGRAVIKVEKTNRLAAGGRKTVKVVCSMESNAFVSAFFSINDKSWSLIDAEGGYCHVFDFDKQEGRSHVIEHTECDYENNTAQFTLTKVGKEGNEVGEPVTLELPCYVADPVTAFLYFRLLPSVKVGDEIGMPVLGGRKWYAIRMKATKKAFIKLRGGGVAKAVCFESTGKGRAGGSPFTSGGSSMWIDVKTRLPLRITSALKVGSMTMYLVKAKNVEGFKPLTNQEIREAQKEGYR